MSDQITFQDRNHNGITMENIINVADCCRACLRNDCTLTPTSAQDSDSIKFSDKLLSCVSEVMWQNEGFPSFICTTCIERLRVAHEFRNICLQSDHTLHRYISHLQDDKESLGPRLLTTPTKYDFAIPCSNQNDIPVKEEPENEEDLHLKLLDNDDLFKNSSLVEVPRSNSASLDSAQAADFVSQPYHEMPQPPPSQLQPLSQIPQQTETVQTVSQIQIQIQVPLRQVITRTTRIQVGPPTPTSGNHDGAGAKPFICSVCGKSYQKNATLRIHMRSHTGEKPFQCAVCSKRFTIKGQLNMHFKSHTGEKPYACTSCDRRCLTAKDLKVHMHTHTGEKPFSCVTCGKKFANKRILKSHIKTHTGDRPFICKICGKSYTESSHLNVHMRKHTGEKICCKKCDAKFTYSSQLTVHMREHTGKQPYKCPMCDKICNYASKLQTHMMKHTGEKFTCDMCDKKFTMECSLQEHRRIHTGKNLSTCMVCDKQFTRPQYLQTHMRIHTGEKPYSCTICERRFSRSSELKVHNKKHKKHINL